MAVNQHTVAHKIYTADTGLNPESSLDSIRNYAVSNFQHIKRGDLIHLVDPTPISLTLGNGTVDTDYHCDYYIYDGQDVHRIPPNGDLPEMFKVVTEFPIQYWNFDIEIFDTEGRVNFDYQLFRDQIVANLTADEYDEDDDSKPDNIWSTFIHNGQEYKLMFDRGSSQDWSDEFKQDLIAKLDSGEGYYFSAFPVESVGGEENYPNTLYCIPDRDSWDEQLYHEDFHVVQPEDV